METYTKADDGIVVVVCSPEKYKNWKSTTIRVPHNGGETCILSRIEQKLLKFQIIEAIKSHKEPDSELYTRAIGELIYVPCIFGDFVKAYHDMEPTAGLLHLYMAYKDKGTHPFLAEKHRDNLFIGYINAIKL